MELLCDLQVEVNGEETFFVDKNSISLYSGKFRKMFGKSVVPQTNVKVIFNDFPGGAETFELVARFCYNDGGITFTASNIVFLQRAARFMDMEDSVSESPNLLEQTHKAIEETGSFSWSELIFVLKQCQDLGSSPCLDSSTMTNKILDSLAGKLSLIGEMSPCASISSQDSSGARISSDSRSTESLKNSFGRATWWFDDLVNLTPEKLVIMVKSMLSRKIDHTLVTRFLCHYQKVRICNASSLEKKMTLETIIDLLHKLEQNSVSCKTLFGILRVCHGLDIKKQSRNKLEMMIGSRLDQATLDNLLFPSPNGSSYLYDVNLVLRFLKGFFSRRSNPSLALKKVANLMDLYIAEVAPDPCLKPSKLQTLIMILPESARESHDNIYRAIDMYLQVHLEIPETERVRICLALNVKKLSDETFLHLSRNTKFPLHSFQTLRSQQTVLKSPIKVTQTEQKEKISVGEKLDTEDDNQNLQSQLRGIQWRVMELERACKNMHTQMVTIMKASRSSNNSTSLPKLCS